MYASSFARSLVNPLPKPLKCFMRFLNGIHVSRLVEWQLKMTNIQDDHAPVEWQKVLNILRTRPKRPSPNNPWGCRHHWDQLWSLPGDLNRKFEHVPYCLKFCSLTFDKRSEFVTNNCMVIIPHPPYLLDLAPCHFALFPKLKIKLKGMTEIIIIGVIKLQARTS
jgi:hypothetical protein